MRQKRIFSIIIFLSIFSTGLLSQDQKLRLHVKILQVPPFQFVTKSVPSPPAKEGEVPGVSGIKTGGPVTQDFPDGILMFDTEIDQSEEDLIRIINEKAGPGFPVPVSILPVAEIIFQIDPETCETTLFQEKIYPLPPLEKQLSIDYKLQTQVFPFSIKDDEIPLKSTFSAKYKAEEGEKKLLFDRIVGVKNTTKLVVGFPAYNNHRKWPTIYWLTFHME